jgi:Holliday junction resolvase
LVAIERFVDERGAETSVQYMELFDASLRRVAHLFKETDDLLELRSSSVFSESADQISIARYLTGPPISADDLDTLSGSRVSKRKRVDPESAEIALTVIEAALDRRRFPWLFASPVRRPTSQERQIALKWTAGLKTAQEMQTARRAESSSRQESEVAQLMTSCGFQQVPRRPLTVTGGLSPEEYCRESRVEGVKCDIPIGLKDGRFLLIECKVSNSAINGVKRLNRETVGKARHWRDRFGARVVTAAVLSGVFKQSNLAAAQDEGVTIFWQYDLQPLAKFVTEAV